MNEDYEAREHYSVDTEEPQSGCRSCGNPEIEEGYRLGLCKRCRDGYRKRPFPTWVKTVFVLMVLTLALALTRFPSSIKAGIAFERGMQAEKAGKYLTAVKEYRTVTERFPDSTLSLGRLFIALYNNGEIGPANEIIEKIGGRTMKNQKLVIEINNIVGRMDKIYYASDRLNKLFTEHTDYKSPQFLESLKAYLKSNPEDVQACCVYSNILYDQGEYDEAKSVMADVMDKNADFYEGQLFMAAIHREQGDYEKAKKCCEAVIRHNSECSAAYSSLARVELKFHKDREGLDMAKKAYELNNNDSTIAATLSIAYHYNGLIDERDAMYERFKEFKDNNLQYLELMNGIFGDKLKWRN